MAENAVMIERKKLEKAREVEEDLRILAYTREQDAKALVICLLHPSWHPLWTGPRPSCSTGICSSLSASLFEAAKSSSCLCAKQIVCQPVTRVERSEKH